MIDGKRMSCYFVGKINHTISKKSFRGVETLCLQYYGEDDDEHDRMIQPLQPKFVVSHRMRQTAAEEQRTYHGVVSEIGIWLKVHVVRFLVG